MTTVKALISGRWYEVPRVEEEEVGYILTKLETSINVWLLTTDETTAINLGKADVIKFVDEPRHIDVQA